jgi:hypothetical protein
MKYIVIIYCLTIATQTLGTESENIGRIAHTGNFSKKRQPNTNFGFGQNILSKGKLISYLNLYQQKGDKQHSISIIPQLLYGITDSFSITTWLPCLPQNNLNCCKARGIGNLIVQLESALYETKSAKQEAINQITIVANIGFPTAQSWASCPPSQQPSPGFNATNFFFGITASHLSELWYGYLSPGAILTTQGHTVKMGNQFLYQGGGGRYLGTLKNAIFIALLDINGNYSQKDRSCSGPNNNTGGNIIFVGPSLSITANQWEFKGGIQFPIVQHFNGTQGTQQFQTLLSTSILF